MRRSTVFWIVAFMITVASAYYQRRTGPTYPICGNVKVNANQVRYRLERSHGGESNFPVHLKTEDPAVSGVVEWKHHGVDEAFTQVPMMFAGGTLSAELPHQPPAGKLDYRVRLKTSSGSAVLPEGEPAVVRFKAGVPSSVLIPHILAMFGAMLLSTRTGLEVFNATSPGLKPLIYWTLGLLIAGGMILGPIMQKYAFGAYWTGWPFGSDMTDNKTLVAVLVWIVAAIAQRKAKRPEVWTAVASVVLLAAYMIPHSVLGSEAPVPQAGAATDLP